MMRHMALLGFLSLVGCGGESFVSGSDDAGAELDAEATGGASSGGAEGGGGALGTGGANGAGGSVAAGGSGPSPCHEECLLRCNHPGADCNAVCTALCEPSAGGAANAGGAPSTGGEASAGGAASTGGEGSGGEPVSCEDSCQCINPEAYPVPFGTGCMCKIPNGYQGCLP